MKLLPKKRPKTAKEMIREGVGEQTHKGVPRMAIWVELMNRARRANISLEERMALSEVETEVLSVMVDRNLRGKQLEKEGREAEAIKLYEANLTDCFNGTHPYERLRILYTRQGDYKDAIRVCETYINMADEFLPEAMKRDSKKLTAYKNHLAKLKEKIST